ncbi:MAG TPA: T9SS type A sorting domain-containing protein [Paludibacteraceae bacterium]|nr:T9SS type A sorting domain-containing protein [Paludibacteraceae bacterium]HPH62025.1 T9SS type A sorting domain-containing protein [Paludibacteraceae bacterium]
MVYPTCFEDYIAIDLIERNYDEGKVLAELISIEGKVLMKKEITNQISSYFETPSLAKGMYFVKISNNGKSVTYKAFKK